MTTLGDFCMPLLGMGVLSVLAGVWYFTCRRKSHPVSTFDVHELTPSWPEPGPRFFHHRQDPLDESQPQAEKQHPVAPAPEIASPTAEPHSMLPETEPVRPLVVAQRPCAAIQAAQDNLNHKLWHQLVWLIPNTQWLETQEQSLTHVRWLCLGPDHHYFIARAELHQDQWHWNFTKA